MYLLTYFNITTKVALDFVKDFAEKNSFTLYLNNSTYLFFKINI